MPAHLNSRGFFIIATVSGTDLKKADLPVYPVITLTTNRMSINYFNIWYHGRISVSIPPYNSHSNLITVNCSRVFTALVTVLHLDQTFNVSDARHMMKLLTKHYDLNYSRQSHFISVGKGPLLWPAMCYYYGLLLCQFHFANSFSTV